MEVVASYALWVWIVPIRNVFEIRGWDTNVIFSLFLKEAKTQGTC